MGYHLWDECHDLGYFLRFYDMLYYLVNEYGNDEIQDNKIIMDAYNNKIGYDSLVKDELEDNFLIYFEIVNFKKYD